MNNLPRVDKPNVNGKEPTEEEIQEYMHLKNQNWYNAREALRNKAYGGLPPEGYSSWGHYWKSL